MAIDAKTAAQAHEGVNAWFADQINRVTTVFASALIDEAGRTVAEGNNATVRYGRALDNAASTMMKAHAAIEAMKPTIGDGIDATDPLHAPDGEAK